MTLFPEEIHQTQARLIFSDLQGRLLRRLREEVRNGMCTERGLARKADLSQPHIHNLLKGIRALSTESADALLKAMSWGVPDLIDPHEMGQQAAIDGEPRAGVPLLSGSAGPGGLWDGEIDRGRHFSIPCRFLAGLTAPAVLRLLSDPELVTSAEFALVDRGPKSRTASDGQGVYVVAKGSEARLRYVRFGRGVVYLPTAKNLNRPCEWEEIARHRDLTDLILARVWPVPENQLRPPAAWR